MRYSAYSNTANATTNSSYDAATLALIARELSPSSAALRSLIDTTIVGLKTDGVFALADALYIRGTHESTLACQNWIKNAHNSTLTGPPTYTPKVGFSGVTGQYINNNYTPSTEADKLTLNEATVMHLFTALPTAADQNLWGCDSVANTDYFYARYYYAAPTNRTYMLSNGTGTGARYTGLIYVNNKQGFCVRDGGNCIGYLDGTPVSTVAVSQCDSLPNYSVWELGKNGAIISTCDGVAIAASFYGGKLTATQITSLYNRVKYFYDNVGGTF